MSDRTFDEANLTARIVAVAPIDLVRIFPTIHSATPLVSIPSDSRFGAADCNYSVLYFAENLLTSFVEVVVRDRFDHAQNREVSVSSITQRSFGIFSADAQHKLQILNLTGDGCVKLGIATKREIEARSLISAKLRRQR